MDRTDETIDFLKSMQASKDLEIRVEKKVGPPPIRKPKKGAFFRVKEIREEAVFLGVQDEQDQAFYFMPPAMKDLAVPELRLYQLVPCVDRYENLFVWPLKLPMNGQNAGRSWLDSARRGAEHALGKWVKLESNKSAGAYDVKEAPGLDIEPYWAGMSTQEIIEKALKEVLIKDPNHEVILRLEGKI